MRALVEIRAVLQTTLTLNWQKAEEGLSDLKHLTQMTFSLSPLCSKEGLTSVSVFQSSPQSLPRIEGKAQPVLLPAFAPLIFSPPLSSTSSLVSCFSRWVLDLTNTFSSVVLRPHCGPTDP